MVLASSWEFNQEWHGMKLAMVIGVLGVLLGYFLGKGQAEKAEENAGSELVARSSRGFEVRGARNVGSRESGGRVDVRKRALEVVRQGEEMSELSEARLIAWIMRLESGDFPEILNDLAELGSRGELDPFSSHSEDDYLKIGLCRWYELEGNRVLDWILGFPEVLNESNTEELIGSLVQDQFERDANLGIEALEQYARILSGPKRERKSGLSGQWRYLVGRWSGDPLGDFSKLLTLEKRYGLRTTASLDPFDTGEPDPFDGGSGEMRLLLVDGMVNAGKADEARDYLITNSPGDLKYLDSIINDRELMRAKSRGWRDLKDAIESGQVSGSERDELSVFRAMKNENFEDAVRWYLQLNVDGRADRDRVQSLIGSGSFLVESTEDELAQGKRLLNRLAASGEPVEKGWEELFDRALGRGRWNHVEEMRDKVSDEKWKEGLESIGDEVLSKRWLSLGGETIYFWEFDNGMEEVIQKFGLENQLLRKVEEGNRKGLQSLNEVLGTE